MKKILILIITLFATAHAEQTQNTTNTQASVNTSQIVTDTQNSTNNVAYTPANTDQSITNTQNSIDNNTQIATNPTPDTVNTQNTINTQIATSSAPATVSTQNKTNIQTTTNPAPANVSTQNTIPAPVVNPCLLFNNIAMQFSLIQPGMQAPLNLEQLKAMLGNQKPTSTSVIINYTWIHKNRILVATTTNNDLTNRLLTGNDDGSIGSKKMEQIYEKLKTATSIWIIKEIRSQLGPERTSRAQLHDYIWHCGNGRLQISADENNNIKSAQITYATNQDPIIIESQVGGTGHAPWDIVIDSTTQHQRGWKRTFT